jgi:hypothetical protein
MRTTLTSPSRVAAGALVFFLAAGCKYTRPE